jgi:hypothetical protein
MASKKALAIQQAKQDAEVLARWERLENLVLALAEKAGIDVDAVLSTIQEEQEPEVKIDLLVEELSEEPAEESEPVKPKRGRPKKK